MKIEGPQGGINAVVFVADGTRLATAGADAVIRIWDAQTGQELAQLNGHTRNVVNLAATPDGKLLLSGAQDGTARLWDLATQKETRRFDATERSEPVTVAIAPDGRTAAITDYDARSGCFIRLFDLETGKETWRFRGLQFGWFRIPSFSADARRIAAGAVSNDPDTTAHTLQVWDVTSGRELRAWSLKNGAPSMAVLSPDGARLLVARSNGASLFDVASGEELKHADVGRAGGISYAGFAPGGREFIIAGPEAATTLRDAATFDVLERFDGNGAAAFSPTGDRVAVVKNEPHACTVRIHALRPRR